MPRTVKQPDQLPLSLRGWLPVWDVERRRVDLQEVVDWTLGRVRAAGIDCTDLASLRLDGERARDLAAELTRASVSPELRRPLHRAFRALIPEIPWRRVWVQTYAHFRILVPGDTTSPVPPHTDYGFGHALDERNLWLALTDAHGASALHLWSLGESLAWMVRTGQLAGVIDVETLRAVPVESGEALLFTPLHVHGARPTNEGARVSIDVRIIPRPRSRADYTFSPLWRA